MAAESRHLRHVCSVCGMAFQRNSHLERHTKTHLSYKEYSCDACGRDFVRRDNLARHQRTFHPGVVFSNSPKSGMWSPSSSGLVPHYPPPFYADPAIPVHSAPYDSPPPSPPESSRSAPDEPRRWSHSSEGEHSTRVSPAIPHLSYPPGPASCPAGSPPTQFYQSFPDSGQLPSGYYATFPAGTPIAYAYAADPRVQEDHRYQYPVHNPSFEPVVQRPYFFPPLVTPPLDHAHIRYLVPQATSWQPQQATQDPGSTPAEPARPVPEESQGVTTAPPPSLPCMPVSTALFQGRDLPAPWFAEKKPATAEDNSPALPVDLPRPATYA